MRRLSSNTAVKPQATSDSAPLRPSSPARRLMSTMSEQLEWIEESESTYVAQSGKRRYVISKQSDGQWAVGLSDGGALFSAKVNKPRLAATLEEAEQIAHGWQSGFGH